MIDVDGCMFMFSHCTVLIPIISFTFKVSHVTIDIATLCAVFGKRPNKYGRLLCKTFRPTRDSEL